MFRDTPRVVTLYSQGVNQSAQGTDKVNAILNCHLATARIGKVGASPFSLTGQPNAMGGREVGGLANQLAAHMAFTPPDIDRVRRFWNAPRIATHEGLKAVQMFDAIARGEIKALWVMGTNPAVSLPDADAARTGLKKLELFVVSENVRSNDTVDAGAHVLLPAQAWGEKSGTVTNSQRRISRQRAFLTPPDEAKPDWNARCREMRRSELVTVPDFSPQACAGNSTCAPASTVSLERTFSEITNSSSFFSAARAVSASGNDTAGLVPITHKALISPRAIASNSWTAFSPPCVAMRGAFQNRRTRSMSGGVKPICAAS